MTTAVEICNIGQALLGAEPLGSVDAPRTSNEKRYAAVFPFYRDSEIRKRRWNFAKELHALTPTGTPITTDDGTLYRYQWPGHALRPLRDNSSEWKPAGRQLLWETSGTLRVWFLVRPELSLYDTNFSIMLGSRLAEVLCEAVTQSNEKKKDAKERYAEAMRDAAQSNAFEIGPELIAADDDNFSWVAARNA